MAIDSQQNLKMTDSSRQYLLKNLQQARNLVTLAGKGLESTSREDLESANTVYTDAVNQVAELKREYEEGLPEEKLSRCPFSGEVLIMPIDSFGLDGPWWESENGARPAGSQLASLFAFSGAINLGDTVPHTPFICKPGPEVPFVNPRLLTEPAVKAVVSSISIGKYQGYLIAYFSENIPFNIPRVNSWGLNYYVANNQHGKGYRDQTYETAGEYDFELEPWIRAGKLLWIAPGDGNLMLRSTVSRCPYLQLQGRQYPVGLLEGEIWNALIDELK